MILRSFLRALFGVAIAGLTLASLSVAAQAATTGRAGDAQIAKQGALVVSDFPSDWTPKKATSSSDAATEKVAATIPDCKQYIGFEKTLKKLPRAKSPDFDLQNSNSSISNTADVFKNAKSATAAMKIFGSSTTESCINKLFSKLVTTKDVTVAGQIKQVQLTVGDQSIAYAGTITATPTGGAPQTLRLSVFAIRAGRGVNAYNYVADSDQSSVLSAAVNSSMRRFEAALA
jgi:hypothetical protein